jgi:type VI secretion system secreted protein VgrG
VSETITSGRYATSDYDFKKSQAQMEQMRSAPKDHAHANRAMYRWGHGYTDPAHGEHLARVELERQQQGQKTISGQTNARGMAPGHTFRLTFHPDDAQNAEYLITGVRYDFGENPYATGDDVPDWSFGFVVEPSTAQYRPARKTPRPEVWGIHTARVAGPAGEEIWCDRYGRVKLQFPWDRYGKSDENSSCWVRVSGPWAGGNFGAIHVPRIGQEVLVEYINGDINRPVIVGRVHNDFNMPPWELPTEAMISGVKSHTCKGSGYNELSMDDTAGSEKITIHAQYDMNTTVLHDQTNAIKRHRSTTLESGDDTLTVSTGSRTVTVGQDSIHTVQSGDRRVSVESGAYTVDAGTKIRLQCGLSEIVIDEGKIVLSSCGSEIRLGIEGITVNGILIRFSQFPIIQQGLQAVKDPL